jgi:hypothetical protein
MALFGRVKDIILAPSETWREIAREPANPRLLLQAYVASLAAIPAVADFIGMTLVGFATPGGDVIRIAALPAFTAALFVYAMSFVITTLQAVSIYLFAPRFNARTDIGSAFKLAAYSYTPAWLAGIFLIIPGLRFLVMLGLYGLYVLYKGLPLLAYCPEDRAFTFAGLVTAIGVTAALIVGLARSAMFALPGIL